MLDEFANIPIHEMSTCLFKFVTFEPQKSTSVYCDFCVYKRRKVALNQDIAMFEMG